ncbi:MAG: hypothetical protein RM368_38025 [Nostoc sp. DedSLP03]|uniref:hypothetical protein n=1 Tax=Nostoc sp. DedSLP03 TaxID=3075400 RepID=UPI002AD1E7DC|nr:hypothetical protein [Nostoc sp. DedSLP03]MDZ7970662.1 hypothetical protein [Nostoc sp. DedSLP03]
MSRNLQLGIESNWHLQYSDSFPAVSYLNDSAGKPIYQKITEINIPVVFDKPIIAVSVNTTIPVGKIWTYAGYLRRSLTFEEDNEINIYSPQRLSYRSLETEIFYFPKDVVGNGLGFLRLDDTDVIWSINVQVYQENMFYSSINKTAATNAQPANDASVTTSKTLIVNEKADGSRHSCLFSNTGPSTVYFKYVPVGIDYAANTVIVSGTVYDFSLAPGEKFLDDNSSQNAVVGICTGLLTNTAKVKVTEYIYS